MNVTRRGLLTMGTCAAFRSAFGVANSESRRTPITRSVTTSVLRIGYHELGSAAAFPVLLLHGFPDDAHAYDTVAPALATEGYRTLSIYLRGFGPTQFRDASAPRTAEQAAIGQDVIDFADALKLKRFAVCGYDWGGRAACIAAAFHPERVRAAVLIGGYTIQDVLTPAPPALPADVETAWYQWYFNTETGRRGLAQNRRALCKFMWQKWSPTWRVADEDFDLTAQSFDNPDFVDCVVHSYRHRIGNAPGEARFVESERRLALRPKVDVPSVILHGGDSGFGRPATETTPAERTQFPQLVARRIVEGAGHFVTREKPTEVVSAVLQAIAASSS
jgi:pimeloyl-ACP methyl ester carboxylesterase